MKLIESPDYPKSITDQLKGVVPQLFVEHLGLAIVFSTDNCPFEEGLAIQLFSKDGKELERVELYDDYAPAQFKLVSISDEGLVFTFWSDDQLVLQYLDKKRRVFIAPTGIHYSNRLASRHLIIKE